VQGLQVSPITSINLPTLKINFMTILAYLIGGGLALYFIFGTNLLGKSCPHCTKIISNAASVCHHCTREIT